LFLKFSSFSADKTQIFKCQKNRLNSAFCQNLTNKQTFITLLDEN